MKQRAVGGGFNAQRPGIVRAAVPAVELNSFQTRRVREDCAGGGMQIKERALQKRAGRIEHGAPVAALPDGGGENKALLAFLEDNSLCRDGKLHTIGLRKQDWFGCRPRRTCEHHADQREQQRRFHERTIPRMTLPETSVRR